MRRIRLKPRFWVIVAVLIIGSVILCGCHKNPKGVEESKCTEEVLDKAIAETNFYLDIPLEQELQRQLHDACEEFSVDYYIMVALIDRETRFQNVIGDSGDSIGYCQIQPKWWYGLMEDIGADNLAVPKDNFRTACAIMRQLMDKYESLEGALVAYNTGSYKGYSTEYSRDIIAKAEAYKKEKCLSQRALGEAQIKNL